MQIDLMAGGALQRLVNYTSHSHSDILNKYTTEYTVGQLLVQLQVSWGGQQSYVSSTSVDRVDQFPYMAVGYS